MLRSIVVLLFTAQLFLTFKGVEYFGKFVNPALLFLASISIPLVYLFSKGSGKEGNERAKEYYKPVSLFILFGSLVYISVLYNKGFAVYDHPVNISDVIPQLEMLWDRFANGEQPYYVVDLPNSKPFPVYMPAHWLPIGLAKLLSVDLRWIGLIMVFIMIVLMNYYHKASSVLPHLLSALVFPAVLYCYYIWGSADLFVSFETPVAAYYLLLAFGLLQRNLVVVFSGIILCMLSRYTLIFWLPLFALILLKEKSLKQNLLAWSSVIGAVVIFYVLPFITRQPDILSTGVKYHNYAAAFEWEYGAWSFETGVYFAPHFNKVFSGSWEQKILYTRMVQGSLMILLNIAGWFLYRKLRGRINFYDFGLIALYVFLVTFYAFSPLTYRYYLITTLLLSGVICMNALKMSNRQNNG